MKVMIDIATPPQVHTFKHLIWGFMKKGHQVHITIRDFQMVKRLLDYYGFNYDIVRSDTKGIFSKVKKIPITDHKIYKIARRFKPDIFLSLGSPYLAHVSAMLRKPHIALEDTEVSPEQYILYAPFTDVIITPRAFNAHIDPRKHIRIDGYKELAYLHPNRFHPNPSVLDTLGIARDDKYAILRFSAFGASHDVGIKGFTLDDKRKLVSELSNFVTVFISSEVKVSPDLERYHIAIPPHLMHDALYYSTFLIGDTQTSTTEAACLGTPAIRSNSFVGPKDMTNFIELEQKYNLIYNIAIPSDAIKKAVELAQTSDLKEKWFKKRDSMLKEKIDVTAFMLWFIEEYPDSFKTMSKDDGCQKRFM